MSGVNTSSVDADIDIGSLFAAIMRNWMRIAVFTLAVTAVAAVFAFTATPRYSSEARVFIGSQESIFTREGSPQLNDPLLDREGITSQAEIIRSSDLIATVAQKLNLADRAEFRESGFRTLVRGLLSSVGLASNPDAVTAEQKIIRRFRERLAVYPIDNTRVIFIGFSSEDPNLATEVANGLARAYLDLQRDAKIEQNTDATRWLEPEIEKLRDSVRTAEAKVAEYRVQSGLLVGQNNSVLATQQLSELSSELSRVRASRATAKARAEAVAKALAGGASLDTLPEVLSSDLIGRLREREVELRADIADLSTTLLDEHPRIIALKSQLDDLQEQIRREASKVQKGLEQEASTAELREEELARELNRLKAASGEAGEQEVRLRELEREADSQRELLESYLARYRAAASRNEQNYAPADARIFEAVTPIEPSSPNKLAIIAAAFIGSLLIAVIAVMVADIFSGRAMRPARVPRHAYHVPMQPAPAAADEAEAVAAAPQPAETTPLKAATRRGGASSGRAAVQTRVQHLAERVVAGGLRRVVAISAEGNEAAAASIMLARAISDTGLRTLLVDLTSDGAASAPMLDADQVPGITDLLCEEAEFSEVIHGDLYSDAHVVPVGTANTARAVRALDRLPAILGALNTAYEMVVVEAGPSDPEAAEQLIADDTALVMNAIDTESDIVALAAAAFYEAGFEDIELLALSGADAGRGSQAA